MLAFLPAAAKATPPKPASPESLLKAAKANPTQTFSVIVEGDDAAPASTVAAATVEGATRPERESVKDADRNAKRRQQSADDLQKKAAKAQIDAGKTRADAEKAAKKAAATGKLADQNATVKAQQNADLKAQQAADALAAVELGRAQAAEAARAAAEAQATLDQVKAQVAAGLKPFTSIVAVTAQLTGAQVVLVAKQDGVVSVVPDAPVQLNGYANPQKWVEAAGAKWLWGSSALKQSAGSQPAIAFVDSGIDNSGGDFGGRILTRVDLTGTGFADDRGHGTMVASIAAGQDDHHTGVNPKAKLVSIKVVKSDGSALTSDVIRAADWILQNKDAYGIRVANFSLSSSLRSSFLYDPLDKAVERLWLSGGVVVTSAGNYAANGRPSGVLYAPANDPFVITVGAADVMGSGDTKDDTVAPWSSFGYTPDGFAKPELVAPGRYMIGASPQASALSQGGGQDRKLVSQGYLQLSGTSFSAPVVSGAAAALLALHPDWTPGQVKGALMQSATDLRRVTTLAGGVGELDIKAAVELGAPPPNPNQGLAAFLVPSPSGGSPLFDAGGWLTAVQTSLAPVGSTGMSAASTTPTASWSSASWSSASWSSASWSSASWSSASWASASWTSASWASASWTSASWTSAAILNNALADGGGDG